jgi:hypothetical protein
MSTIFTLRAFREGDENALVKHANNPNVAKYLRNIFPALIRMMMLFGGLILTKVKTTLHVVGYMRR